MASSSLLFRRVLIVLALVFLVLLYYAVTAIHPSTSAQDAVRFVKEDLANDPAVYGKDYVVTILSAGMGPDASWEINTKVTTSPHTQCPEAFLRTYHLLPIRHDLDKVITANCKTTGVIAFPEEAIIASREFSDVKAAIAQGAQACAFDIPINPQRALDYCPNANVASLASLTLSVPQSAQWLVQWTVAGQGSLYAILDSKGQRLS